MNWLRLHVSNLCNFKCPNCHVFELSENNLPSQNMNEEVFDHAFLTFIKFLNSKHQTETYISLYGGESLANKKLILKKISEYKNHFQNVNLKWIVNTNGSLLNEDDINFFKENSVEIHISIDGKEEIHNLSRPTHKGSGTFQLILPNLELIKTIKPIVQLNSYLMPTNIDHLKSIVDIAKEFEIRKIYLDQFYNLDMISHEYGLTKYREVYFYALQHEIELTGPWSKVLTNFQKDEPRIAQLKNYFSVDVNIDGSFYFSQDPQTKKAPFTADNFGNFLEHSYQNLIDKRINFYQNECNSCSLKMSCFGNAIEQVQYHIGPDAKTAVSCDFFRDWMSFLNRPIFYSNEEKLEILSLYELPLIQNLINTINTEINFLEKIFWKLDKKIFLHILQFHDELKLASKQTNLPEWTKSTTSGENSFFHLGPIACLGIRHELVHFFLNQKKLQIPKWVEEGICEWYQDPSFPSSSFKPIFDLSALENSLLIDLDSRQPNQNQAYQAASGFIAYLLKTHGENSFINVLKSCESDSFNQSLIKHTNKDLSEHFLDYSHFQW